MWNENLVSLAFSFYVLGALHNQAFFDTNWMVTIKWYDTCLFLLKKLSVRNVIIKGNQTIVSVSMNTEIHQKYEKTSKFIFDENGDNSFKS